MAQSKEKENLCKSHFNTLVSLDDSKMQPGGSSLA